MNEQYRGVAERILVVATQRERPRTYQQRVEDIERELDAILAEHGESAAQPRAVLTYKNTILTHVVRSRAGLYVSYNNEPTYAPVLAKLFSEADALMEAAARPKDEGWNAFRAPHLVVD